MKFKFLFARIVQVTDPVIGNVSDQIAYPTMSEAANAFLGEAKQARAVVGFQEALQSLLTKLKRSETRLDLMACLDPTQFDAFFLSLLKNFRFQTEPLTIHPTGIRDKLSLVHLARPRLHSASYHEWRENGNTAITQEFANEESTKRVAKSMELYRYGICDEARDVGVIIANLVALAT